MAALREIFATFGVTFDAKPLAAGAAATDAAAERLKKIPGPAQLAASKLAELTNMVRPLVAALSGPALAFGLARMISGSIETALANADMARAIGTTSMAMQEWQHVASASGIPVEVMSSALGTLSQNMRSVQQGNGDMAYAFRRLHVPVRDANRNLRDTSDVMAEAGRAIASIENPTRRARLAVQIFGDAGRQLIPIFEGSGKSIEEMRAEVRGLLGGDMKEMEAQSRRVRAEQARFNLALQAVTTTITLIFLPAITWLVSAISTVVRFLKSWLDTTYILQAALATAIPILIALFLQLGIAMVAAFGPALVAMAPFAAAIAAIVLVVDDLWGLFTGGNSLIGEFIDTMAGVGASARFVREVKVEYEALIEVISDAFDAMAELINLLPGVSVGRITRVTRQATRGFIAPGSSGATPIENAARALRAPGSVGVGSVGVRRAQDVRVTTTVGQIVVEGAGRDPVAIAEEVRARIADTGSSGARNARAALTRTIQSEDSEIG
jgi:hypothetical protein